MIKLTEIIECSRKTGLIVFPVFYHVHPSDVREQRGTFAEAFASHESNAQVDKETIQKWRAILTDVANMSLTGWVLHEER